MIKIGNYYINEEQALFEVIGDRVRVTWNHREVLFVGTDAMAIQRYLSHQSTDVCKHYADELKMDAKAFKRRDELGELPLEVTNWIVRADSAKWPMTK